MGRSPAGASPAAGLAANAAVALAVLGRAAGAGAGPGSFAPQWSAKLVYSAHMIGTNFSDGHGQIFYDQIGQRYRLTFDVGVDVFEKNGTQHQDQLFMNVSGTTGNFTLGRGPDGVCLPFGKAYNDLFGWLQHAERNGSKLLDGTTCDVWEHRAVEPVWFAVGEVHHLACLAADGVPREYAMTLKGEKVSGFQHFRFSGVARGDPGDGAFENSAACATNFPSEPCAAGDEGGEGTATLELYRVFGPPEPMELANRDAGDAMGDLSFMCTQGSGSAYRSKLITHWSVEVDKAFGQYAMCNFNGTRNVCAGPPEQLRRVGRRASQMMGDGPHGGQCSPNAQTGSQYSFPAEGACPPGVRPGAASGCSWGNARPLRTIHASCVMEDRGLLQACARELGHAPFLEAKRIFEAAFASDDPANGGCPDAVSGDSSTILV